MRNYEELVGQPFGKFVLEGVSEVGKEGCRKSKVLHFVCVCGTKKSFTASKAGPIFSGSTVSCGCVRKDKWRKAYYAWKNEWERKGLL